MLVESPIQASRRGQNQSSGPGQSEESKEVRIMDSWATIAKDFGRCSKLVVNTRVMKPVEPVSVVELFPPLSRELLTVLRSLQPTDWAQPTICSPWSVKEVAAHLLGGNLGRLWNRADKFASHENPVRDYDELVCPVPDRC